MCAVATASLPMYDFAELTDAHDALWAAVVAAHGDGLPATLTHADDVHALWHAPTWRSARRAVGHSSTSSTGGCG